MKKHYFSPQLKCFRIGGLSALCNDKSMPISSGKRTEGDAGGWSKQFWGVADDDEEEIIDDTF